MEMLNDEGSQITNVLDHGGFVRSAVVHVTVAVVVAVIAIGVFAFVILTQRRADEGYVTPEEWL
jgi:hypothetical protein